MKNYIFIMLAAVSSFAVCQENEKPTFDDIINSTKARISFTFTRNEQCNKECWASIATTVNDLIDQCNTTNATNAELVSDIFNIIVFIMKKQQKDKKNINGEIEVRLGSWNDSETLSN